VNKGAFRLVRRQFCGLEARIPGLELQTGHDGRADQVGGGPLPLGPVVAPMRAQRRQQPQDDKGNRPQ
jgi:hypothetical protein